MTAESINEIAGHIALAAAIPAHLNVLVYGVGSPWYRSWLGRILFAKWLSVALVFDVILARRWLGDYAGYEWVAVFAYSFIFIAFSATTVELIIERRPSNTPPPTGKATSMSDVEITTNTVPEIWYASKRVIRTVLVNLVVILPVVNVSLPLVVDAFTGEGVPVEVTVLVNTIVVGILVVTGILTRIIAIPAVNAWLTKLGAGSVPKSAVENGLVAPTGGAPLDGK